MLKDERKKRKQQKKTYTIRKAATVFVASAKNNLGQMNF